jgi:hypothetical protein
MFVDTQVRPQGEQVDAVAPSRMKLSDAVRECGYSKAESLQHCVLGRAYTKLTGRSLLDDTYAPTRYQYKWLPIAAEAFRVPLAIVTETEAMCYRGESPAQIADWLEAQGL